MKRKIISICVVSLLCVLSACGNGYRYGGLDVSGNDPTAVVKEYYKLEEAKAESERYFELYSEHLREQLSDYKISNSDLTLLDFTHCKVVDDSQLRKSDIEFLSEHKDEYYAFCYVQTADSVYCNEDCATGQKGETVKRQYAFTLVMETEDSNWQIYDYGYPPFYIPEE